MQSKDNTTPHSYPFQTTRSPFRPPPPPGPQYDDPEKYDPTPDQLPDNRDDVFWSHGDGRFVLSEFGSQGDRWIKLLEDGLRDVKP